MRNNMVNSFYKRNVGKIKKKDVSNHKIMPALQPKCWYVYVM